MPIRPIRLLKLAGVDHQSMLTLSGPGFFWVPGAGGGKCPRPITLNLFMVIEMKFGRVVENHKLINLVEDNWQITSSLHHDDVRTVEILNFYEILPNKIRKV